MNDTVMIVGGVIILLVLIFGAGTIYRFAFRRGKGKNDVPTPAE